MDQAGLVFVQYQFKVMCTGSELPAKPALLFLTKMQRTDRHHHSHGHGHGFLLALIH